ncbi:hypothetical protein ACQKEK_02295 [Pseudomonas sp. NPDC077408]|uniref:hypothetical protein n=1 Tax=Streptomyces parvus TaxID=66428 RepID=UPI00371AF97B
MNTLSDLRAILGETMRKVMDGDISVDQAKAVAMVAGEVNATARLEVDMARATDGDFRGSGFIDVEPRIAPREPLRRVINQ